MKLSKDDIRKYLASEGLQPEEKSYGFYFRYQMRNFFIEYDEDDDQYLRLIMPGIYEANDDNMLEVLQACNEVDQSRKVIKCYVSDSDVDLAAELLVDETPILGDIVPRALGMLLGGQETFYKALKG